MDKELVDILNEWKVAPHYIEKLNGQEVYDVDTLMCLSDKMLEEIFDKVGPRASFMTKRNALREKIENVTLSVNDLTNISIQVIEEHETLGRSMGSKDDDNSLHREGVEGNQLVVLTGALTPPNNPEAAINVTNEVNAGAAPSHSVVSRPVVSCPAAPQSNVSPSTSKKRPLDDEPPLNLQSLDVEFLLKTSGGVKGRVLLAYYQEHGDLLESHRNFLADLILSQYLKDDSDRKLSDTAVEQITTKILQRFPDELKEEWNPSSVCASRDKSVGRGVLVKRYYNMRKELKKANLINKKSGSSENRELVVNEGNNNYGPDYEENLLWLNHNKQPWSKVIELWKSTAEGRIRKFFGVKMSIQGYFDLYPCLKDNSGFLLLESDYEHLFPGTSMNLYVEWPSLAAFIESKVPPEQKEKISACLTSEGKKIQTVWSISHLFPVTTVAKKGKEVFRPSRQESAESLLLLVKSQGDIVPTVAAKVKIYDKFNLALAPRAILVGDDEDSVLQSFVRLNGILYKVDSPLQALDITFKVIHALDAEYQKEGAREWHFLERAIYKINVEKGTSKTVKDFEKYKKSG